MATPRILTLIGSPRATSTSAVLANCLLAGMTAHGWQVDTAHTTAAMRKPAAWDELERAYLTADVVLVSTPLYVDSLPSDLTLALERLAALPKPTTPRGLVGLVNCGFIEAKQNDVALAILEQFTREAGVRWLGGLAVGGGGMVGGQSLEAKGGMLRPLAQGLRMAGDALAAGKAIPDEAQALIRTKPAPLWMYAFMANLGMIIGALQHHNLWRINARPYSRV